MTPPGTLPATIAYLLAFAVASATAAGAGAVAYRWYVREPVPVGLTTLVGVATVALYLNTKGVFGDVLGGEVGVLAPGAVAFNVGVLAAATLAAPVGTRVGDRVAADLFEGGDDPGVSRLSRTLGRVAPVELPETVDVLSGHDPVPADVRERIAGETLLLPRGLTPTERRDRVVTQLKERFGVDHVDIDVADDGTVEYLAVGARVAGLGPTLAPGTVAVAVRADPANAASPGDVVQVWGAAGGDVDGAEDRTGTVPTGQASDGEDRPASSASSSETDPSPPGVERVCTGEVRGTAGDVATLAVDAADAARLDADREYRLVTLPATPRADREFTSLLRAADETMGVVAVAADSDLVDRTLAELGPPVVAVATGDGAVEALPDRDRTVAAGDTLYVVARPEVLRRLEAEGGAATRAEADESGSETPVGDDEGGSRRTRSAGDAEFPGGDAG